MCLLAWYQQPIGQQVYASEKRWLQAVLPHTFGYYLIQLGNVESTQWLSASPILHRIGVSTKPLSAPQTHNLVTSEFSQLPFASDSIDAIILAHVLEFCDDPLAVLSESYRCLIPEGRVFILSFNPASLWGLWALAKRKCDPPWDGKFIRPARLRRWLVALDYDVDAVESIVQRPPTEQDTLFERLAFLEKIGQRCWPEKAGCYGLSATKKIEALTPLRPIWREKKSVITKKIAEHQPQSRTAKPHAREINNT